MFSASAGTKIDPGSLHQPIEIASSFGRSGRFHPVVVRTRAADQLARAPEPWACGEARRDIDIRGIADLHSGIARLFAGRGNRERLQVPTDEHEVTCRR